ncbi:hypothetical protein CH289_15885 [Rhodococcus sp. RS1C4]|nr:hypothetical protein [Rhodococcus sp. RS1C4]OZC50506.1 hypothetical protein CH289_15885 [Rhodococcus sp. RS1C4]
MIALFASSVVIAAEPVLTAENVGVASALITAVFAGVATIIGARSRNKLDALAQAIKERDEAREELAAEKEARKVDRAEMRADHDVEIDRLRGRVRELEADVDDRNRRINKLDRLVLAFRTYVARLTGRLADNNIALPDKPDDLRDE